MTGNRAVRPPSRQAGFTYLALLFAISIAGVALAGAGVLWSTQQAREREAELLFIGNEYRQAISSYYEKTPGAVKRYPGDIEALLEDLRFPAATRHLRRPYRDPITNQPEWGLVRAPDGGIMGVYSLSASQTIKRSGFRLRDGEFEGMGFYRDWRFTYEPQIVLTTKN